MVLVKSAWSLEDDLGTRYYANEDSSLDAKMKDMMMFDDFEIAMKVRKVCIQKITAELLKSLL